VESKKNNFKGELGAGEYFGELALLNDEPRAATISAKVDLSCLVLTREDFKNLLGPLKDIMERKNYTEPEKKQPKVVKKSSKSGRPCEMNEFKTIGILGKGAFGMVTLIVDPNQNSYAMKAIHKRQIIEQGQQQHILTEKRVMEQLSNPFLVNLIATYRDKWKVYFLLDVCLGGELFTILRNKRSFDENTSMFYAGNVIEGFAYMHSQSIIYRDLKPENLVLANNGYLKITDFGFAKYVPDKTFTLCGTPDYLAPEIVTGQGHGLGVDWWTLGILIYEMVASLPPFYADKQMETYRKIVRGKVKFPRCMSREIKDLIGKLLKTKSTKRYGVIKGGAQLIRDHPWFKRFDWSAMQKQQLKAPFVPKVKGNADISNFDKYPAEKEDKRPIKDPNPGWDDEF
jgi:serine/threonine protein kinase